MNLSLAPVADVPPFVVTVMSTIPAAPAGEVAVICVGEFTVKLVAALAPNLTPLVVQPPFGPKFVPVIVTGVPPPSGPAVGFTTVTVGAGHAANAASTFSVNGAANAPITTAASNPPSARRALLALESRPLDSADRRARVVVTRAPDWLRTLPSLVRVRASPSSRL